MYLTKLSDQQPTSRMVNQKYVKNQNLGSCANVGNKEPESIFIDKLIEQSLAPVGNELKYKVNIVKSLDTNVIVMGFPQKLLKVFINMLVNASHTIENKGKISINSRSNQGKT